MAQPNSPLVMARTMWSYAPARVSNLSPGASLQCPPFTITTADGARFSGRQLLVSIGNGVRTGGGFYLTPNAYPDDGLIDLCIVKPIGRMKVLSLLPKSLNGSHVGSPEVTMVRTEHVDIDTDPAFPMHVDGELVEHAPARMHLSVRPRVLPVLCRPDDRNRLTHPLEKIL